MKLLHYLTDSEDKLHLAAVEQSYLLFEHFIGCNCRFFRFMHCYL